MIPRVSSVSGRWSVTKSAAPSTSSSSAQRARPRPRGSGRRRRTGRSRRPASRGRSPAARPAGRSGRSRARRASCPASSIPPQRERSQLPCFSAACACGMLRASATQEPDRLLRGRNDGGVGRIRYDDAAVCRRIEVDVVDPDSRPADHLQLPGALDQVGGELGRRADDDRVVVADRLREIGLGVDVDVEVLTKQVDARLRDRLADEDARALQALLTRGQAPRRPRAPRSPPRRARCPHRHRSARARPRRAPS